MVRSQLRTIFILFVALRLALLLLVTPQGLLNAYTDYHFYFNAAQFTELGRFPFVNMWFEYPPVAAYLPLAAYGLARAVLPPGDVFSLTYLLYARLLGALLLVFEAGTLVLLHRCAERAWGTERADTLAWIYASLSLPLFYWMYGHQTVVTFFLLLALYGLMTGRWAGSAAALGLGIAAKLTPAFFLAPAGRFLWGRPRRALAYGLIAAVVVLAAYAPFVALGGARWIAASFTALAAGGSWATPWALLDGNWGTGYYGPLENRLDLGAATLRWGNPPAVSPLLTAGLFGLLSLPVFRRRLDGDPRALIWLTTAAALIFHLWSKGWSPQWAATLIPLLLLAFPGRGGLTAALALTGIVLLEWPLAEAFGSRPLLATAIAARTLLFAGLALAAAARLGVRVWPAKGA